jgi:hypothetical protein
MRLITLMQYSFSPLIVLGTSRDQLSHEWKIYLPVWSSLVYVTEGGNALRRIAAKSRDGVINRTVGRNCVEAYKSIRIE